jgi:hypothetical protein
LIVFTNEPPSRADDGPIGVDLPDEEAEPPDEDLPADEEPLPEEEESPTEDQAPAEAPPAPGEPTEETEPPGENEPLPSDETLSEAPSEGSGPTAVVLPPEPPVPETPPEPEPPPTPSPASPAPTKAETFREPKVVQGPPAEEEKKKEIFSWFTLSPQVGYLFFPKSNMEFNGLRATVDTRNGIVFKLHFDLGGDDLAFEIAPIFALELGGIHTNAQGFANLSDIDFTESAAGANLLAAGGEATIVYRFPVNRFFPHIGAGFRGTYLFGDEITYGTELYGRFPIGLTAYLGKHIAFVFEIGLMAGATGVRTPPKLPEIFDTMDDPDVLGELEQAETRADFENWYRDNKMYIDGWIEEQIAAGELPQDYNERQMTNDFVGEQMSRSIRFGSGFGMDVTIGIRFP